MPHYWLIPYHSVQVTILWLHTGWAHITRHAIGPTYKRYLLCHFPVYLIPTPRSHTYNYNSTHHINCHDMDRTRVGRDSERRSAREGKPCKKRLRDKLWRPTRVQQEALEDHQGSEEGPRERVIRITPDKIIRMVMQNPYVQQ
ncbi:hypothetical protein BJY52DRAFT_1286049 [Lactarius psammicola]|nr:hypothetical protein BJY52DRAFT_1286049 [Lactarius psammicola]